MLRVDFVAPAWRGHAMDDDTVNLVVELCTHVGMLMEDASVLALTLRQTESGARMAVLRSLVTTSEQIGFLLNGAVTLQGS